MKTIDDFYEEKEEIEEQPEEEADEPVEFTFEFE